jgi:hypothetical protein
MAYSSVSDARSKIQDPENSQDSTILFANNNLLNNTTIFYTNAGLTSLAPSGNYVIPDSQFRTYFVSLGNDGKIVSGSKEDLILSGVDSSWVDDQVALYSTGEFVPNDNNIPANVGTKLTITPTTYLVSDEYWSSRSYTHSKKWIIDQGTFNTTALTNIDVSAMKGYELRLMTGEWYQNTRDGATTPGFTDTKFISAIIHVAEDLARVTQEGKAYYYFRPDYMIPLYGTEYPSFFKRLPNVLPINDKNSNQKEWLTKSSFLFDMVLKGTGSWDTTKRTYRNSTMDSKGYTLKNWGYFKDTMYGVPPNANYWMRYDGSNPTTDTYKLNSYSENHIFDNDTMFKSAAQFTYNLHTGNNFSNPYTDAQMSWVVGLWESLLITDPIERGTWRFINGFLNKSYIELNPYYWTTAVNSGTNYYDVSPANQMLKFFNPNVPSGSTRNLYHGKHVQFDYEICAGPGRNSENFGLAMDQLWNSCKTYSIANNWSTLGGVIPQFSNYADSIYLPGYEGSGTAGWRYVDPSVSVATAKTTDLYKDYKEYYLDGTRSKSLMTNYHPYYKGAINSYYLFFCTDYLKSIATRWFVYNIVHSYDISKKIILEILGTEQAKTKRVCGYGWQFMEQIGGSDFDGERKGYMNSSGGLICYKPNTPPSHNQTLAVWSFAYMDGLYLWDNNPPVGGEFNHYSVEDTPARFTYGDLFTINNGAYDWFHIGYWQVMQNRDIVGANTDWSKTELKIGSTWTSNTDSDTSNLPIMLYNRQRPISVYKLSADGTEALLIITNPFNNGYTMDSHTIRLPTKSYQEFTIKTWGNFTSVIRLKNL